jgi:hypothetical protein
MWVITTLLTSQNWPPKKKNTWRSNVWGEGNPNPNPNPTHPTPPKRKKGNSPNLNPSSAHKHNTHLKSHYNWFSITLPTNPIGNRPCFNHVAFHPTMVFKVGKPTNSLGLVSSQVVQQHEDPSPLPNPLPNQPKRPCQKSRVPDNELRWVCTTIPT